jgi:uncharacterized membrane protein YphA (DoxX/SURF4 family)
MFGLFTRPVALLLGVAHLLYWLAEPLPQYLIEGSRLFGSRGAPTDHLVLPALFFVYLSLTGPGPLSLDRWLGRDIGAVPHPRWAAYSLTVLRVVAGFLFIFHGTGKIASTLDPNLAARTGDGAGDSRGAADHARPVHAAAGLSAVG